MTFWSISLVAMALLHTEAAAETGTVEFSYWAAQATQENREKPHFDADLNPIRKVVSDLPFDTYRSVRVGKSSLTPEKDQEIKLDGQYALHVTSGSKSENGRIRLDLRIAEKLSDKKEKTAVESSLNMQPDKMVKVRGLRLKAGGELVLVMQVH